MAVTTEYEIITVMYNRKTCRFIMILRARGYNSLSYPTLHYKVWSTNVSKCKPIQIGQPDQLIQVKSFLSVCLNNLVTF